MKYIYFILLFLLKDQQEDVDAEVQEDEVAVVDLGEVEVVDVVDRLDVKIMTAFLIFKNNFLYILKYCIFNYCILKKSNNIYRYKCMSNY